MHKNFCHAAAYDAMDTDNKLIINLRDLGHVLRSLYEGRGSQKQILILLYESGVITQGELTRWLQIQPGSVSEVVGKLEHAGLIERTKNQSDRRTTDIHLTEEGRIRAEEAARQRKHRHQEMFSCLSAKEKEELLALFEKLNADWDSRYGERIKAMKDAKNQEDSGNRQHAGRHPHHH